MSADLIIGIFIGSVVGLLLGGLGHKRHVVALQRDAFYAGFAAGRSSLPSVLPLVGVLKQPGARA